MKYFTPTYYFLVALCLIAASCSNSDFTDETDIKEDAVRVRLTMTFPTSTQIGTADDLNGNGENYERYINDVRIFAFINNKFVEEASQIITDGEDGSEVRTIYAALSKSYNPAEAITLVTLVNSRNRGVNIDISTNNTKEDLYKQLVFAFENPQSEWSFKGNKQYIPMWGELTTHITNGVSNEIGTLQLVRAIAKVGITVRDGVGIDGFQINKISLYNYNSQGYCAPTDGNANSESPYIPSGTTQSSAAIIFNSLTPSESNQFLNKIYIPEHLNKGVNDTQKVSLEIEATVGGQKKIFPITFENDRPVLRNHSYIFNITSVTTGVESDIELKYEVIVWNRITVPVPPFG